MWADRDEELVIGESSYQKEERKNGGKNESTKRSGDPTLRESEERQLRRKGVYIMTQKKEKGDHTFHMHRET